MEKEVRDYYSKEQFLFRSGRVQYTKAGAPLCRHLHAGSIEIVYLVKGRQSYLVEEEEYELLSGDVFLTFPEEIHSSGSHPEDKSSLYYLIVDIEAICADEFYFYKEQGKLLKEKILHLQRRLFPGSYILKKHFQELQTELDGDSGFANVRIRNVITEILLQILEDEKKEAVMQEPAEELHGIANYIENHLTEEIRIEELAELMQLSVSRFKIWFREKAGIPPREYILRKKIERAKERLMETEIGITELSNELAFSSGQYFSTVFRRYVYMTPREYRRSRT